MSEKGLLKARKEGKQWMYSVAKQTEQTSI
jgi:hypothetical protein